MSALAYLVSEELHEIKALALDTHGCRTCQRRGCTFGDSHRPPRAPRV